jgi:hypothetical protein
MKLDYVRIVIFVITSQAPSLALTDLSYIKTLDFLRCS